MTEEYPPDYWLHRAREARAVAETLKLPDCRKTLLEIALRYERMADAVRHLDQRGHVTIEGSGPALESPQV